MNTLFVNNLTVMDFSYLHTQLGLLGESWLVDIELDGSLDHQGMVLDFGDVKKQVKALIDDQFDHRLILPGTYDMCRVTTSNHRCDVEFTQQSGETVCHNSPTSAITELNAAEVTVESLAVEIGHRLQPLLPDNVSDLRIRLHSEAEDGAWYRYSHGLKHHSGNCQRIAHGHRSRIDIYIDGKKSSTLESKWAAKLKNSYIGTNQDLIGTTQKQGIKYYHFGYTANQGLFALEIPASRCYLVDTDSTVENLAQHLAQTIKMEFPKNTIKVIGYEGVGKGAVGIA